MGVNNKINDGCIPFSWVLYCALQTHCHGLLEHSLLIILPVQNLQKLLQGFASFSKFLYMFARHTVTLCFSVLNVCF